VGWRCFKTKARTWIPRAANKTFTLDRQEEPSQKFRLQLLVLRFGFFQDGNVGIGVFPEGEEVVVCGAGLGGVAGEGVGAGEAEVG
jgi:hypothetical protein